VLQCPACHAVYISNTIFCSECGAYLQAEKRLDTDPIETARIKWLAGDDLHVRSTEAPDARPWVLHLHIGQEGQTRELELSLVKPIRLGRNDPREVVFPEVDLTDHRGKEYGVSREHACIIQRNDVVEVEDLGSTNGTLLNGERLAPYIPKLLRDGDQLRLGKLQIRVSFASQPA